MITHPEKILFPEEGITKGELASYYEAIAPVMLPHLRGRPITMERYHRGIGAAGFFQKDVSKGFPDWLERVEVPKHGGTVHHPIASDIRSLSWLANQNSITIHVWPSRTPNLYNPDICIFDLDPSDEEDLDTLRRAALLLRQLESNESPSASRPTARLNPMITRPAIIRSGPPSTWSTPTRSSRHRYPNSFAERWTGCARSTPRPASRASATR